MIIRVVLLFPHVCIRGVSLSSTHYNQSRHVYINQRHQYIRLIWRWNMNYSSLISLGVWLASSASTDGCCDVALSFCTQQWTVQQNAVSHLTYIRQSHLMWSVNKCNNNLKLKQINKQSYVPTLNSHSIHLLLLKNVIRTQLSSKYHYSTAIWHKHVQDVHFHD